jgi:hypothetical protein
MKYLAASLVAISLLSIGAANAQSAKAAPPKNFEGLTWIAGTRFIERDGVKSYETWTGPAAGQISGTVASASNGGLLEFFKFGPNEAGVYGLSTARTTTGLANWSFRPLKTLEARKVVFADAKGSFTMEPLPDGDLHTYATTITDGKEAKTGEWFWRALK